MLFKEIINFFLLPLYVLSLLKCSHCEAQRERERERGDRRELANPQLLMPFNCPQFSFNLESSMFVQAIDNVFPTWCRQRGMPVLIAVKAVSYVRTLGSDIPSLLLNLKYSAVSITFTNNSAQNQFYFIFSKDSSNKKQSSSSIWCDRKCVFKSFLKTFIMKNIFYCFSRLHILFRITILSY